MPVVNRTCNIVSRRFKAGRADSCIQNKTPNLKKKYINEKMYCNNCVLKKTVLKLTQKKKKMTVTSFLIKTIVTKTEQTLNCLLQLNKCWFKNILFYFYYVIIFIS